MLQSVYDIIYELLISERFAGIINTFDIQAETGLLVILTSCVLVCLTISFVFKFILKLVDR